MSSKTVNYSISETNSTAGNAGYPLLTWAENAELTAWLAVTLGISLSGALFNVILLLITWPRDGQKSSLGVLVFHFVAVNLLMCLVIVPYSTFLVLARRNGYELPVNMCYYTHTPYTAVTAVVNWSDTVLAINRAIALVLPHKYRAWSQLRCNLLAIAFVWIMGFGQVLIAIATTGIGIMLLLPLGQCTIIAKGLLGKLCSASGSFVPYGITLLCAIMILWKTRQYKASVPAREVNYIGPTKGRIGNVMERRLMMAKMLLFTFLWSALCCAPNYVLTIAAFPKSPFTMVSSLWFRTLQPCQYGFTPCVLLLSNGNYREKLSRIIRNQKIISHASRNPSDVRNPNFNRIGRPSKDTNNTGDNANEIGH